MYRFTKLNPVQAIPFNLQQQGLSGPITFTIGANSYFNIGKSQFNISYKIPAIAALYAQSTGLASQTINRITIKNKQGRVLEDIIDSHLYAHAMFSVQTYNDASINPNTLNTQVVGDRHRKHNYLEVYDTSLLYANASFSYASYPALYQLTANINADQFITLSADFSVMFPKTFAGLDRDIFTSEEIIIEITLNKTDDYIWYTTTSGGTNISRSAVTQVYTAICNTLFINLYTPSPTSLSNFEEVVIAPEIQKTSLASLAVHNVRTTLKPKEIFFINWSTYDNRFPLMGRYMYPNTVLSVNQDTVIGSAPEVLQNYDIRVDNLPIKQLQFINTLTGEHLIYNKIHTKSGICSSSRFFEVIFTDVTVFDSNSLQELDPNTNETLKLKRTVDLSLDVTNASAIQRQYVFVIGYKNTIKYTNGVLHL